MTGKRESKDRPRGRPPFRPKKLRTALPRPEPAAALPARKQAERVAKVIARVGLGSRREIEAWIAAGRVRVNGQTIASPALNVGPQDRIEVDDKPLQQRERTRLFLYHKPRGLVTTTSDPEGRPTIFAALPKHLPRLISVGRLDINTEGLLLLTNDGGLARVLELPETGWLRRYRVRALGEVTQPMLDALRDGIEVEGIRYGAIEASIDRQQGYNSWLTFAIREGKNREVRNVLGALGLQVNRLIRLSFGPFQLGELKEGDVEEVATRALHDQLGERIAAQAGADFSGPISDRRPDKEPARRATRFDDRRVAERAERKILERRPVEPPREATRSEHVERPHRGSADARPARREDRSAGRDSDRAEKFGKKLDKKPDRTFDKKNDKTRERRGDGDAERKEQRPKLRRHFSPTRVWREEPKPLRRTFHGQRGEPPRVKNPRNEAAKSEQPREKRSGVIADRQGRSIAVERFATKPKEEEHRRGRSEGRDDKPRYAKHGEERQKWGRKPHDDKTRGRNDRDSAATSHKPRDRDRTDPAPTDRKHHRRGFDRAAGPRPSRPKPR